MSQSTGQGAVHHNDRGIRKEGCISDPGVLGSAPDAIFTEELLHPFHPDDMWTTIRLYREVTGLKETEPRRAGGPSEMPVLPPCPGQLYLVDRSFFWTVNPSVPSTLTAPVFPPSKSPEPSCWPVAHS